MVSERVGVTSEGEKIGYPDRHGSERVVPWLLALGPPGAFLLVLGARYFLTDVACAGGGARVLLELVAALGVAATALPGWLAWRRLGRGGLLGREDEADDPDARPMLLRLAVLLAVVFVLLAVATWMPSWALPPCRP